MCKYFDWISLLFSFAKSTNTGTEEVQQLVFDYLSDDGKLNLDEYREILCKLIIDDDFVQNIMNHGDTDGDGLLSISELVS